MAKQSTRTIGFESLEHRCLLAAEVIADRSQIFARVDNAPLAMHNLANDAGNQHRDTFQVGRRQDSHPGVERATDSALMSFGIGGRIGERLLPMDKPDRGSSRTNPSQASPPLGTVRGEISLILVAPVIETTTRIVFVSQRAPQPEIQLLSLSAFASPTNSLPPTTPPSRAALGQALVNKTVVEHEPNDLAVGKSAPERFSADSLVAPAVAIPLPYSDSLRIATAMDTVDAFPANAMEVLEWNPLVTNASSANAVLSFNDNASDRVQSLELLMQQIAEARNQPSATSSSPTIRIDLPEATQSVAQAWLEQASQMVLINDPSSFGQNVNPLEMAASKSQPTTSNHWTRGIGIFRPVQSVDGKLASGPSWFAWLNPAGSAASTSDEVRGAAPRISWLNRSTAVILGSLVGVASFRFSQRRIQNQNQISAKPRRRHPQD